jgi:hypothetical protein
MNARVPSHTEIALGLTAAQLAKIFRTSTINVQRKVSLLSPVGFRNNAPIYDIAEAAQFLVKATADIEQLLKEMRPSDMPASLQKDFWGAQLQRQTYEEKAGKLWKTDRVQEAFGSIFKLIRQRVVLFTDTVDRQHELSTSQRLVVQTMADALLEDIRLGVVDLFENNYDPAGERDDVFENGPPKAKGGGDFEEFEDEDGL